MKRKPILFLLVGLLLFVYACPMNQNIKPFSEWTPKEKATFWMKVYNDEYAAYQQRVQQSDLFPEQKEILKAKKKLLTEIYEPLKLYVNYTESGRVPTEEMENILQGKMNDLETLILKEVSK